MFATPEQVKAATGYDVDGDLIFKAQFILESFTGRGEAEVVGSHDREVMNRAVIYQAAYMSKNYDPVYEQVAFTQKSQTDASVSLDTELYAPYLAPLAVFAMNKLSWTGTISVSTGPMYSRAGTSRWETE